MRTNCTPHTQPGRGVVIIAPPTVRCSEQILYAAIYNTACKPLCPLSGIRRLSAIRVFLLCMETAVGACNGVRYSVDVRYWECPLIESPLYRDDQQNK